MAISLTQSTSVSLSFTNPTTLTLGSTVITGNLVIVVMISRSFNDTFTVTDNISSTYTLANQVTESIFGTSMALYYTIAGAGITSISASSGSASIDSMGMAEFSGASSTADGVGGTEHASAGSNPSINLGSPSNSGTLGIGSFYHYAGISSMAGGTSQATLSPDTHLIIGYDLNPGAGSTEFIGIFASGSNTNLGVGYRFLAAATAGHNFSLLGVGT